MKSIAILLLVALSQSGCSALSYLRAIKPKTPETRVEAKDGSKITLSGDTPNPSTVSSHTSTSSVPVPEATKVTFNEKLGTYEFSLPKAIVIETRSTNTEVKGATSYQPPKAPTLSEVSQEGRKGWLYLVLFIGAAAGIFGLVERWQVVMLGGAAVAAAAVVGLFINNYPWLIVIIAAGGGFAVAGPYIWHIVGHKNLVEPTKT